MIEITCENQKPEIKIHGDIDFTESDLILLLVSMNNKTYFNDLLDHLYDSMGQERFENLYNKVLFAEQLPVNILLDPKTFLEEAKKPYIKVRQGAFDDNDELL